MKNFLIFIQFFILFYFVGFNFVYLLLNIISFGAISRHMQERWTINLPKVYSGYELPISILVPAFNEESTIESTVLSLLQLSYSEYEIIVINDGSDDKTLEILIEKFSLRKFPEAYRLRLPVAEIESIYQSTKYPKLKVIDKQNGGKSDSLNAGINISRYPLFCCIDADSFLQRDSIHKVVKPFLDDPKTIATGGIVRLANGCKVKDGLLVEVGLPKKILGLIQVVEYLRAFLFGRLGWSYLNALLIVSGTFSVFNKEAVVTVGGYKKNIVGEDMELIVRLHKHYRLKGIPYKITFVPDPICWTDAPENLRDLKTQRMRWHQGLSESLSMHMQLLFHPKSGLVGWMAFPFMLFFEWFGPIIEVMGYIFFIFAFLFDIISYKALLSFTLLIFAFSLLISLTALILEELSSPVYMKFEDLLAIFLAVIIENIGYRQLISFWRVIGLWRWYRGKNDWGKIKRVADWQETA